jgi:hypothetical protein
VHGALAALDVPDHEHRWCRSNRELVPSPGGGARRQTVTPGGDPLAHLPAARAELTADVDRARLSSMALVTQRLMQRLRR